jgi:hypothetical protein
MKAKAEKSGIVRSTRMLKEPVRLLQGNRGVSQASSVRSLEVLKMLRQRFADSFPEADRTPETLR